MREIRLRSFVLAAAMHLIARTATAQPSPDAAAVPEEAAPSPEPETEPGPVPDVSLEEPAEGTEAETAAEPAPVFGAEAEIDSPNTATTQTLLGPSARLRPFASAGDLLAGARGMFVVQHGGGGKAQQYFVRGFDADHGTDVAFFADGIPLNAVSHGHGQGYTELHWIIPELIESIEVRKGPYFADVGDFGSAATIDFRLDDRPRSQALASVGMFQTYRAVGILSRGNDDLRGTFAGELYGTDGPSTTRPEDLHRVNLFGRVRASFAHGAALTVTATSHVSDWFASGQIPLRAVRDGSLDRFGTEDGLEGGTAARHSLWARLVAPADEGTFDVTAWVTHYRLALYSNFTFFLEDPVNGDMIRQGDRRTTTGLRAAYSRDDRLGATRWRTRAGIQVRIDAIHATLDHAPAREITEAVVDASVGESSAGLFIETDTQLGRYVRAVAGLRGDAFLFDVRDALEDRTVPGDRTSGERQAMRLSPKLQLTLTPHETFDLYASAGFGYHSNDARGVVRAIDAASPLAWSFGYEAGARARIADRVVLTGAFFGLELDSEVVWIGDAGTNEPRGSSRRLGVESGARATVVDWLRLEIDASWSRATFVDNPGNANAIALAPTWIVDAGVVVEHPIGLAGRIGLVYLADRPATEDRFLTADGFTRVDARIEYRHERFSLGIEARNLTNTRWRQAQFATASRLPGEDAPASCPAGTRGVMEGGAFAGCEDISFTPGTPLQVLGSASLFF